MEKKGKKEDFEFLKEKLEDIEKKMATKDDIANMATKDDIANMTTKDDLKGYATKEDLREELKKYATKEDIADVIVMIEGSKRYAGILQEETNHKIDLVLEGFQMFNDRMGKYESNNEQEHKGLDSQYLANKAGISGLDKRVGKLEKKSA
jgi:hypothetical protein